MLGTDVNEHSIKPPASLFKIRSKLFGICTTVGARVYTPNVTRMFTLACPGTPFEAYMFGPMSPKR